MWNVAEVLPRRQNGTAMKAIAATGPQIPGGEGYARWMASLCFAGGRTVPSALAPASVRLGLSRGRRAVVLGGHADVDGLLVGRCARDNDRPGAGVDGDTMDRWRRGLVQVADGHDEAGWVPDVSVVGDVQVVTGRGGGDRRRGWRRSGGRWCRERGLMVDRGLQQRVRPPVLGSPGVGVVTVRAGLIG